MTLKMTVARHYDVYEFGYQKRQVADDPEAVAALEEFEQSFNAARQRDEGRADDLVAAYDTAIAYLRESPRACEVLDKLVASGHEVQVDVGTAHFSQYLFRDRGGDDVYLVAWNPTGFNQVTSDATSGAQSPAMGLLHELGHALQSIENPDNYARLAGFVKFGHEEPTSDKFKDANLIIEGGNILDNEGPVCAELTEPRRFEYRSGSSGVVTRAVDVLKSSARAIRDYVDKHVKLEGGGRNPVAAIYRGATGPL